MLNNQNSTATNGSVGFLSMEESDSAKNERFYDNNDESLVVVQAQVVELNEEGNRNQHDDYEESPDQEYFNWTLPTNNEFYKEHCIYLVPMLGWFLFSTLLSLYNKYIFGDKYMAFPCPLFMTSIHFGTQFLFSYAATSYFPEQLGGHDIDAMSWSTFLWVAIPCGLITSLDVGLSNLSLVRISITFYTMVKSSAPIFVVLSAYIFGIEKITPALIGTVLIISCGEFLTCMGEVQFDMIGFLLVLSAAVLSGMRWTVVQLQLSKLQPPLKSTLATMRILSPVMWFTMASFSAAIERPWSRFGNYDESFLWTLVVALIGATLAICMILCEFYLIMKSSAIVLMIGGVLKELNTILFGVIFFHDKLNLTNSLGCSVVFSGALMYKFTMYRNKNEKTYDSVDVDSFGSTERREHFNIGQESSLYDYDEDGDQSEDNVSDGNENAKSDNGNKNGLVSEIL